MTIGILARKTVRELDGDLRASRIIRNTEKRGEIQGIN